jgi:hypothetical protein
MQCEVGERPRHTVVCQHGVTLGAALAQPLDLVLDQRGQGAIGNRLAPVDESDGARRR